MGEQRALHEAIFDDLARNVRSGFNKWLSINNIDVCLNSFHADMFIYVQANAVCYNIREFNRPTLGEATNDS